MLVWSKQQSCTHTGEMLGSPYRKDSYKKGIGELPEMMQDKKQFWNKGDWRDKTTLIQGFLLSRNLLL